MSKQKEEKPMSEKEFSERLKEIYNRTHKEVYELADEARKSHGLSFFNDKGIPWLYDFQYNGERILDQFAELTGAIYDLLAGIPWNSKKSLRRKIRKVLGYSQP